MTRRGEISKRSFQDEQETKHFESVTMQMGRVQLDSDWNEAFETLLRARARALRDEIGTQGSPNDGFRTDKALVLDHMESMSGWELVSGTGSVEHFEKSEGSGSIKIVGNAVLSRPFPELMNKLFSHKACPQTGSGKLLLYCKFEDGMTANITLKLIKNDGSPPLSSTASYSAPWQILLLEFPWHDIAVITTFEIHVTTTGFVYLDRFSLDPGVIAAPDSSKDFYIQGGDGTSGGAGRLYVDGLACVKEGFETYRTQKDYPEAAAIQSLSFPRLLYLDVWKRTITAVEDPDIQEVALGGPDTCAREQLVSQVKAVAGSSCTADIKAQLRPQKTGTLTAKLSPKAEQDRCDFRPELDYSGLNNSLYRIEIHTAGDANTATFKWSRNNGADLVAVTAFSGSDAVIVPDDRLLCCGDVVELCDDVSDLADFTEASKYGTMAVIKAIDHDVADGIKITLDQTTTPFNDVERLDSTGLPKRHPKLRKWHGIESVKDYLNIDLDGTPSKELEHGIRIAFSKYYFYHGDFWQFTARVNTRSIEELHNAPPTGPVHQYAPLAIVTSDGAGTSFADCRKTFLPLTQQHAVKVGVDTNYCIERPLGPDAATVLTPENVQQALDNLCGYIRHLRADNIGVDTNFCIERPGGPQDTPHVPANVQQALDNLCGYIKNLSAENILFKDAVCKMSVKNVQEAIDRLCKLEHYNCGIVTVGDGIHSKGEFSDIQTAINSIPADFGGKVCIGAGLFELSTPITVAKRHSLQISGLGPSTLIRIVGSESAMVFSQCTNITVADLKIKTVHPKKKKPAAIKKPVGPAGQNGAITIIDSDHIFVERCTLSTPAVNERGLSCLTVRTSKSNRFCSDVKITDNVFIPGDRQIGLLVLNGKDVTVCGNRIHRDRGFTYQGIVVGGNKGDNIRIENNLMRRVFQGIHVGVSHKTVPSKKIEPKRLKRATVAFFFKPEQIDSASQVTIKGNTIVVSLPAFYERERHGIFVGNCSDLTIRENSISIEYASKKTPVDGIRVFGYLGPLAVVRENMIAGTAADSHAVSFTGLKPDETKKKYGVMKWMIIDNMTFCEDPKQQTPKIYVDPNTRKYVQIIRNC